MWEDGSVEERRVERWKSGKFGVWEDWMCGNMGVLEEDAERLWTEEMWPDGKVDRRWTDRSEGSGCVERDFGINEV